MRDESTSGNVSRSTASRSSAIVPASSTPVAPPPTMVMASSGLTRPLAELLDVRQEAVAQRYRVARV